VSTADVVQAEAPALDRGRIARSRRRPSTAYRRRGWLVRRMLLAADVAGVVASFVVAELLVGPYTNAGDWLVLLGMIPIWVVTAKIYGLYDRDEERADYTTVDDFTDVFHLVTVAVWLLALGSWALSGGVPELGMLALFWSLAIPGVLVARTVARGLSRRSVLYVQNMVIVGAGEVGQLVARKVLQHPEYGIHLVGFVDDDPRARRVELDHVPLLGPTSSRSWIPSTSTASSSPSRGSRRNGPWR
jgi:FlaA1/EpsC-like NDP-sugar epimerase